MATLVPRLAALLLVLGSVLSAAPAARAHFCVEETWWWEDPDSCDAHDCGNLLDEGLLHTGHIVIHRGDGWATIHGCGPVLHYGADGDMQDPYACLTDPRDVCVTLQRPALP